MIVYVRVSIYICIYIYVSASNGTSTDLVEFCSGAKSVFSDTEFQTIPLGVPRCEASVLVGGGERCGALHRSQELQDLNSNVYELCGLGVMRPKVSLRL